MGYLYLIPLAWGALLGLIEFCRWISERRR
jgi:hypothetical protein